MWWIICQELYILAQDAIPMNKIWMKTVWPIRNGFICCLNKQSLSTICHCEFDKERSKKFSFNVLVVVIMQNLDFGHTKTMTQIDTCSTNWKQEGYSTIACKWFMDNESKNHKAPKSTNCENVEISKKYYIHSFFSEKEEFLNRTMTNHLHSILEYTLYIPTIFCLFCFLWLNLSSR